MKLRLQPVLEAECLYINNKLVVFFFVDNIAVFNQLLDTNAYKSFQTQLFKYYKIRDIKELKWFLSI
jgi:hypothetical protein